MRFVCCSGRYLKEKATEVEGTFRVSGSSKRMKDIQALFDSPPKVRLRRPRRARARARARAQRVLTPGLALCLSQYGKYIDWDAVPHTTHDVATIFRRFLTQMPVSRRLGRRS